MVVAAFFFLRHHLPFIMANHEDKEEWSSGTTELLDGYIDKEVPSQRKRASSRVSEAGGPRSPCDVGGQFDELLVAVGNFGRYQQFVVFVVLLPAIFAYSYSNGFWVRKS